MGRILQLQMFTQSSRGFAAVVSMSVKLILNVDLPCSQDAEQDFAILTEQSSLADAHASFDANSGGEAWEHNTRRIATDVVSNGCQCDNNSRAGCVP